MKKIVLLLGIMLISVAGFAQTTNSKGVLRNKVLQLNNGIKLSEGDTIMLGVPVNDGKEFMFIYEPKHGFGLLGGTGADRSYSYRMLIIKYFTTANSKNSSEKKFVASLGYNKGDDIILDCDIAEAVDNGEVIAKGRIPQKFNIVGRSPFLHDVLQDIKEAESNPVQTNESTVTSVSTKTGEQVTQKTTATTTEISETVTEKPAAKTSSNQLLNKINALQKAGYITNNEHYQLLKIITGSDNASDKKELIRKLQTLRNDGKLTINEYDELVDLLL